MFSLYWSKNFVDDNDNSIPVNAYIGRICAYQGQTVMIIRENGSFSAEHVILFILNLKNVQLLDNFIFRIWPTESQIVWASNLISKNREIVLQENTLWEVENLCFQNAQFKQWKKKSIQKSKCHSKKYLQ